MVNVDDIWGAYVDTTQMLPQTNYMYIKEGKYRKNRQIYFDHNQDSITVAHLNKETKALEKKVRESVPNDIRGLVSGLLLSKGQLTLINIRWETP